MSPYTTPTTSISESMTGIQPDDAEARLAEMADRVAHLERENQRLTQVHRATIRVVANPDIKAEAVTALRYSFHIEQQRTAHGRTADGYYRATDAQIADHHGGDAKVRDRSTVRKHRQSLERKGLIEVQQRMAVVPQKSVDEDGVVTIASKPVTETWVRLPERDLLSTLLAFGAYRGGGNGHGGRRPCDGCGSTRRRTVTSCADCGRLLHATQPDDAGVGQDATQGYREQVRQDAPPLPVFITREEKQADVSNMACTPEVEDGFSIGERKPKGGILRHRSNASDVVDVPSGGMKTKVAPEASDAQVDPEAPTTPDHAAPHSRGYLRQGKPRAELDREPGPLFEDRLQPAAYSDPKWLAKYGHNIGTDSEPWFAMTASEVADYASSVHDVEFIFSHATSRVPVDGLQVNENDNTWTALRPDGSVDPGGDVIDAWPRCHDVSTAQALAHFADEMRKEAYRTMKEEAGFGSAPSMWLARILTPKGWDVYTEWECDGTPEQRRERYMEEQQEERQEERRRKRSPYYRWLEQ